MREATAFLDGRFVTAADLRLPLDDAGFLLGVTVSERLRTFGGSLFRLDAHLARLRRSLEIVGLDPRIASRDLGQAAERLIDVNLQRERQSELGLAILVTPGTWNASHAAGWPQPRVMMHTHRLAFGRWAPLYDRGATLVTVDIRQVPQACWPRELKCRSRMHYYLAGMQAESKQPGATPLLLDVEGFVTETPTANVVLFRRGEGLLSPPQSQILPGISLGVLRELAADEKMPFSERPLRVADLHTAEELMLTSTSYGLLPVTRFDGQAVGRATPGPVYRRLFDAWSHLVGMNLAAEARRGAAMSDA